MNSKKILAVGVVTSLIAVVAFAASVALAGPFSLHKGLQIKHAFTSQYGW